MQKELFRVDAGIGINEWVCRVEDRVLSNKQDSALGSWRVVSVPNIMDMNNILQHLVRKNTDVCKLILLESEVQIRTVKCGCSIWKLLQILECKY